MRLARIFATVLTVLVVSLSVSPARAETVAKVAAPKEAKVAAPKEAKVAAPEGAKVAAPKEAKVAAPGIPIEGNLEIFPSVVFAGLGGRLIDDSPAFRRSDLRFAGDGQLIGGGVRLSLQDRAWRGGFGASFYGVRGVSFTHGPIRSDLHLGWKTPYAVSAEVFFGRVLTFRRITLYGDLRIGISLLRSSIDVRSDILGEVQALDRRVTTPIVAPRLGARFHCTDWLSLDVSASASPLGVERVTLTGGVVFTTGREPGR